MTLPDLPQKRFHKEADFGLKIREWIEKSELPSASYELKTTRGKEYFPFAELKEIQIHNGLKQQGRGNLIRVAVGTTGAPDYIWLKGIPYFVVIDYPKGFVVIPLEVFIEEKRIAGRSSLEYKRASQIAHTVVLKKKWEITKF